MHRRAKLSLAVGTAARSVLGHRFLGPIVEFWGSRLAVAERVGALSQWGRTITRRGRLHIGTLHQREPISHAQHMSPWRPHRVLHAGGTAGSHCRSRKPGQPPRIPVHGSLFSSQHAHLSCPRRSMQPALRVRSGPRYSHPSPRPHGSKPRAPACPIMPTQRHLVLVSRGPQGSPPNFPGVGACRPRVDGPP